MPTDLRQNKFSEKISKTFTLMWLSGEEKKHDKNRKQLEFPIILCFDINVF